MPRHDPRTCLRQMRDHAAEALEAVRGRRRSDLDDDRILSLALARLVEIVGEAAARVTPEERGRFPALPWAEVVGMRNRLVHGYDQVDLDVLWQVVAEDFAPLVEELDRILTREG